MIAPSALLGMSRGPELGEIQRALRSVSCYRYSVDEWADMAAWYRACDGDRESVYVARMIARECEYKASELSPCAVVSELRHDE